MRRLILIFATVFVAAGFVSVTTLSADAETADQYQSSDGSEAQNAAPEGDAPDESQPESADFISQGSVVEEDSAAVIAARADVAEEERLPDYSQVVDNTTRGRFSARGWEEQSGDLGTGVWQVSYDGGYVYTGSDPGVGPARFKVRIPTSNDYTVYGWWPASSSNSDATRFGIGTASGTQWTEIDQATEGGIWIKLGTYAMKEGERFIQVSPPDTPEDGNAVADAVAVVRGDITAPPPEEPGTASRSADGTYSTSSLRDPTGRDVVRVAKKWLGVRYKWGTCTRRRMSCTCETKKTYYRFGHKLPMTEGGQWRYDRSRRVAKSRLRIGDEVFFAEGGGGITHVGIYSGNGYIVHASSYFNKVTESKMRYIRGYYGAKRYRLH